MNIFDLATVIYMFVEAYPQLALLRRWTIVSLPQKNPKHEEVYPLYRIYMRLFSVWRSAKV